MWLVSLADSVLVQVANFDDVKLQSRKNKHFSRGIG